MDEEMEQETSEGDVEKPGEDAVEKPDVENQMIESETEEKVLDSESDDEDDEDDDNDKGGIDIDEDVDDDDDKDDDDEDEAEVKNLEAFLLQNPYDYPTNVSLITKLRKMGELDRLRQARENMSRKYPLTPDLWLSWIKDEINLAVTSEQKAAVVEICERAVNDYLSVEVWLEYLQFSIGNMGIEKDSVKNVRQLFERALTAVGLHITKGAIIWEAFREFENVLLAMVDQQSSAEKKEQLDRIGNLFRRQLACPLLDMEKTYEEYKDWYKNEGANSSIDDSIITGGYKRALEKVNLCLPFEEKLLSAQGDAELLDAYKGYLLYEKQHGDPGRITVLYERAITDLCLETYIWIDYINYLESTIKIESVLEQVYKKASRNVPWSSQIWQKWIRSYEKWNKSTLEVQSLLENALSSGFSTPEEYRTLWMTYLEYLRRKINRDSDDEEKQIETIRKSFNRACEHLSSNFGSEGDPNCVILQFWARTEAIHANDMEKARNLWSDILSQGCNSSLAEYWLEYISLERCYGDTKHLRKLFPKALNSVKNWIQSVANAWVDFERDEGTLEQMEICEVKVREKLEKISEDVNSQTQQTSPLYGTNSLQMRRASKRKSDDTAKWKNLAATPKKVAKFEVTAAKPKQGSSVSGNVETRKNEENPKIKPPPGFKPDEAEKMEEEHVHDEVDEKITVFISNLDYDATEDQVKDALTPAGPITMFRMVRDYKGRSKGFCYVQLSSPEAVETALKLDRTPVKGRPMFVSRCNPNKTGRSSAFKYNVALEKNKLFVKGLSVNTTKEDLEEIFKAHGDLKDVRIVTYRNGHSKGLAYVEFQDENSANKALLATDGMQVQGKTISVAISQPPERKKGAVAEEAEQIKSLGGTTTSRTTFGVPRTLLSMVPRAVKTSVNNGAGPSSTAGSSKQPMSNQDFRNMLLKKK